MYYGMESQNFHRGQHIIEQGEIPEHLYFVNDGDFEILYNYKVPENKDLSHQNLVSDLLTRNSADINRTVKFEKSRAINLKLAIIGPGRTVLENDALNKHESKVSVKCRSQNGSVYRIKTKTMLSLIKIDKDVYEGFLQQIMDSNKIYNKRINKAIQNTLINIEESTKTKFNHVRQLKKMNKDALTNLSFLSTG